MRQAEIERNTFETKIKLSLNLDAQEPVDIQTGVGFFDHMLTLFPSLGFQCSDESPPQDSPRKKQSPQVRKSFQGYRTCLA